MMIGVSEGLGYETFLSPNIHDKYEIYDRIVNRLAVMVVLMVMVEMSVSVWRLC